MPVPPPAVEDDEDTKAATVVPFTAEEDAAIRDGVQRLGRKWAALAKEPALQGRSDDALRRRFGVLEKRAKQEAAAEGGGDDDEEEEGEGEGEDGEDGEDGEE